MGNALRFGRHAPYARENDRLMAVLAAGRRLRLRVGVMMVATPTLAE